MTHSDRFLRIMENSKQVKLDLNMLSLVLARLLSDYQVEISIGIYDSTLNVFYENSREDMVNALVYIDDIDVLFELDKDDALAYLNSLTID